MAAITKTALTGSGARTLNETTLGASDTLTFSANTRMALFLRNPTAGALSPTIDGDGGSTVTVAGIGSVDVSSGYAVGSISAGAAVAIPLDTIAEYLRGTVTITGGTGLVATLVGY